MIGDDLRSALPDLRMQAESLMSAVMVSSHPSGTVLNPASDVEVPTTTPGYAGKCKVTPFRQGHDMEFGQVAVMKRGYEVTIPWDAAPPVGRGDTVTITQSPDAWIIGRPLIVTEVDYASWQIQRRFMVEDRA